MQNYFIRGLLSVLFFCLFPTAQSQHAGPFKIETDSTLAGFSILDSVFQSKKIFFTGEDHRFIDANNSTTLAFLKYLNQKQGVNHLMLELGYSWGEIANRYIQTGDSSLFQLLQYSSHKSFNVFFKELYEYNKNLSPENKVQIHGIDVERFYELALLHLNYLIPKKKEVPNELILSIESIQSLAKYVEIQGLQENEDEEDEEATEEYNSEENEENEYNSSLDISKYSIFQSIDSILSDFHKNKKLYELYLGDNFAEFEKITQELRDYKQWRIYENSSMVQRFIFRENYMFQNMKRLFVEYPNAKFYGQFGRCHVSLIRTKDDCNWVDFRSIANRLQEFEPTQDKVVSIGIFYASKPEYESSRMVKQYMKDLAKKAPENEINIFSLDTSIIKEVKYNYILIDKKAKLPYFYESLYSSLGKSDKNPNTTSSLGLNFLYANSGFSAMNSNLQSKFAPTLGNFANHTMGIGLHFNFAKLKKYGGLMTEFGFVIGLPQKQENQQDTSLKMHYTNFNLKFGYTARIYKNLHFFTLLNSQLGYYQLNIEYKSKDGIFDPIETKVLDVYNDVIGFGPCAGLRLFKTKGIELAFETGYLFDFSRQNWKNHNLFNTSIRSNFNGLYYQFKTSYTFAY
jgi:hypothetical protein